MISTTFSFYQLTDEVMKRVRAGKRGRHIMCPNCQSISKVYHFSWSALQCQHCEESIEKSLWSVEQ